MIILKKVRWKNLLSTGNQFTEINLAGHNNTLIIGSNGAGKSTFIEAICFGLFGKPFRNINKPSLLNSINNKDMIIEIELSIGAREYLIRRGMKPNIFEIFQDGQMLNQTASSKDYQDYLEKNVLKLNFRTFKQIVILGSASFVPFMQLPAAARREIIEDLLDIRVFTAMNIVLKEKIGINRDEIIQANADQRLIQEKEILENRYISEIRADKVERLAELDANIGVFRDKINNNINDLTLQKDALRSLAKAVSDSPKIKRDFSKTSTLFGELTSKQGRLHKAIEFLEQNDICPTCKQNIDGDFKAHAMHEKEDTLKVISEGIEKLQTTIDRITKRSEEIEIKIQEMSQLEKRMDLLEKENSNLIGNVSLLESEKGKILLDEDNLSSHIDSLNQLQELKKLMDSKLDSLNESRILLDIALDMLKDKGIKSRIIKQYIPVMNKLINGYLGNMDIFINFELDENFKESVKSRHRDEFSYENFSQGEKIRLDLAIMFSWRDIARMKNSMNINLLIFDEIFDGPLDAQGMEDLMKLLLELGAGTNLFIISHKQGQLEDKFENVIKFEKRHNYSVML